MSKAAVLTLAVLLALVLAASAPLVRAQPGIATDPHVAAMLAQVDPAALYQAVGDLSGEWPATIGGEPYTIRTRHTTSSEGLLKATQYAGERLEALGLEVEYHTWEVGTPPNVIGELPGAGGAEEALILCGHLDDLPDGPVAPGADDNASGSAAVLAAAAILSEYTWTCDLRFALWTGEEQGLLGSRAYAVRAYNSGDQILGVVNLDMIAYNSATFPAPAMDLHADSTLPETVDLAHLFDGVVDAYGLALEPEVLVDDTLRTRSDSWAFVEQDYPAILAIEDYDDFSPYYHKVTDRLSTLDLAYYAEFVRAAIAT
ncbi:MAG: M28 family peptidase, partial [Anaerolineae bacterium]|nr:M28 family peptidase [Anaerolineae bacterium]